MSRREQNAYAVYYATARDDGFSPVQANLLAASRVAAERVRTQPVLGRSWIDTAPWPAYAPCPTRQG